MNYSKEKKKHKRKRTFLEALISKCVYLFEMELIQGLNLKSTSLKEI